MLLDSSWAMAVGFFRARVLLAREGVKLGRDQWIAKPKDWQSEERTLVVDCAHEDRSHFQQAKRDLGVGQSSPDKNFNS